MKKFFKQLLIFILIILDLAIAAIGIAIVINVLTGGTIPYPLLQPWLKPVNIWGTLFALLLSGGIVNYLLYRLTGSPDVSELLSFLSGTLGANKNYQHSRTNQIHKEGDIMPKSLSELKQKNLERQLMKLHEEYEAANAQLSRALSEVDRIRIQRQIDDLEEKIQQVEDKLNQLSRQPLTGNEPDMSDSHDQEEKTQPMVFISYSEKDEAEKDTLLTHLGVLRRAGLVNTWSDDQIKAGADWESEVEQAMEQANVAILLVTANFLNSDIVLDSQIPVLLERRRQEGLVVFPIIAQPCAWQKVDWLVKMAVRPRNKKPVWGDGGSHVHEDLAAIAEEVANIVNR